MNIQEEINKSEELIQWLDRQIDGLDISSDERTRLAAGCLDMALEHQKAIVLLVAKSLCGSAFSIARLIFEAYVRGVWLHRCASESEIEKYKTDKLEKTFASLIQDIEKIDGFNEGVLSTTKTTNWNSMNSYTHSGYLQSVRRNKEETIEPNYTSEEIKEVLNYANALGLLSALQVALLAGNQALANDLLEKSKAVLCVKRNNVILNKYNLKEGTIYDLLDRQEFKSRMVNSFPAVYLTIISIIQGVALGILAQNTFEYIQKFKVLNVKDIITLLPYVTLSFFNIVIVFFEYSWFIGVFRWSPKFSDTFIPFFLGIMEISPLYFLDKPKFWWFLNAGYVLAGAIAYINTFASCKTDMFEIKEIYKFTKRRSLENVIVTIMPLIVFIITAIYHDRFSKVYYWHKLEIGAFIFYFFIDVFIIYRGQKFVKVLHQKYKYKI
ncbi:MAG: hypothetical protein HZA47_09630 [Planctomycetes bacterium]|nr:hypothetical protein [Planctomycetota bacterium]